MPDVGMDVATTVAVREGLRDPRDLIGITLLDNFIGTASSSCKCSRCG